MKKSIIVLFYYLKTINRRKFKNRNQLEKWQDKKVKSFLKKIVRKSPFYKKAFENIPIKQWRSVRAIDKKIMMENFDTLNTRKIEKNKAFKLAFEAERTRNFDLKIEKVTVGLSSGTSGNRGIFLVSQSEQLAWAGTMLAKMLSGEIFSKHKIAFFLRANSNLYNTVKGKSIEFKFFDLLNAIEENIKNLSNFNPTVLVAPASMLRFIAEVMKKGEINIMPKKIISVAEVLELSDQEFIESIFKQKVHQIYQCTEGFLASTCERGTLHLNEELVFFEKEYLDEKEGKFSPIITDFSRKTQPIIRYRLNDILVEKKEPCLCGSPFQALERIEGRCDDIFYFKNIQKTKDIPVFPDFIRRAIMSASDDIEEYLAIQHGRNEIEISLKYHQGKGKDVEKVKRSIEEMLTTMECQIPNIIFSDYQRKSNGTKLRRVERRFDINESKDETL